MEKKQPWHKPLFKLADAMKKNKKLELAVYAALLGLAAILYISTLGGGKETPAPAAAPAGTDAVAAGEMQVEKRLEEILSCIRGAGAVRVMVIYDTTVEIVPAMSVDTQTSTSETINDAGGTVSQNESESKTPVSGQDGALVLTEKQPVIRGVIVVAEGAADIAVRINLQSAVQTVLGIDLKNISVYEMKASG